MVKADAYGHGAVEVSRVPLPRAPTGWPSAPVDEGVHLRGGGIRHPRILVMGGFLPYEGPSVAQFNLTPALHSVAQVRRWRPTRCRARENRSATI